MSEERFSEEVLELVSVLLLLAVVIVPLELLSAELSEPSQVQKCPKTGLTESVTTAIDKANTTITKR